MVTVKHFNCRHWSGVMWSSERLSLHNSDARKDEQWEGWCPKGLGSRDCPHPNLRIMGLPRVPYLCGEEAGKRNPRSHYSWSGKVCNYSWKGIFFLITLVSTVMWNQMTSDCVRHFLYFHCFLYCSIKILATPLPTMKGQLRRSCNRLEGMWTCWWLEQEQEAP